VNNRYLPLLADRCIGKPLLIEPGKAEVIFGVLEGRIIPETIFEGAEAEITVPAPEASRFVGSHRRQSRPDSFVRATGRTALITIDGSLVNRGAWLNSRSGMTSYEGIGAQIDDAASDPDIDSVVLDINSPGGEATGMFGLAAKIRSLAAKKNVVAVVDDMAASAGFGLASAANEIVVSPTSIVGSIGVVMLHLDRSGELQARGIRPTLIHAGAHKVDGNPFGPLPDNVRAAMQRDVMTFYDRFLETVAAGRRGKLSKAAARKTEAQTFIGQEAIDRGLADRIGSLEQVLAELSGARRRPAGKSNRSSSMNNETSVGEMSAADFSKVIADAVSAGVSAGVKAALVANADAEKPNASTEQPEGKSGDAGLTAEQQTARIQAIMTSDEAKGREAAAQNLAFTTTMPADAAIKTLASLPKADMSGTDQIEARQQGRKEIGAGGKVEVNAETVKSGWDQAMKRYR